VPPPFVEAVEAVRYGEVVRAYHVDNSAKGAKGFEFEATTSERPAYGKSN